MGHHRFRLPLLLALPLLAPAALAEKGPQRCNDEITRLMQIRLERAQASWEEENPTPSDFQLEAQYLNQVVKAESIKAHALKKYECRLKLSLPDEEAAAG
jgi:hypothetical protein